MTALKLDRSGSWGRGGRLGATTAERPRPRRGERCGEAPTLFDELGGEPTLDALLSGVWEGLAAQGTVRCPVCEGPMEPVMTEGEDVLGGRCGSCGSSLS